MGRIRTSICALLVALATIAAGQRFDSTAAIKTAESEAPRLAEVLELTPGMTVADVGAGFGAWTIVMAKWLGPAGRIYSTDIAAAQLAAIREAVVRERLDNVVVVEGSDRSTNLPEACCDAVFLRDVYHHLTQPEEINRSLAAALKPGGRLAVIDFAPEQDSKVPTGVPANRGGHGISPTLVVSEVIASGLAHVRTISTWPPDSSRAAPLFLVLFRKR